MPLHTKTSPLHPPTKRKQGISISSIFLIFFCKFGERNVLGYTCLFLNWGTFVGICGDGAGGGVGFWGLIDFCGVRIYVLSCVLLINNEKYIGIIASFNPVHTSPPTQNPPIPNPPHKAHPFPPKPNLLLPTPLQPPPLPAIPPHREPANQSLSRPTGPLLRDPTTSTRVRVIEGNFGGQGIGVGEA